MLSDSTCIKLITFTKNFTSRHVHFQLPSALRLFTSYTSGVEWLCPSKHTNTFAWVHPPEENLVANLLRSKTMNRKLGERKCQLLEHHDSWTTLHSLDWPIGKAMRL